MNLLSNIKNKISDDKIIPLKIIHAWYHWNRKDIHAIKKISIRYENFKIWCEQLGIHYTDYSRTYLVTVKWSIVSDKKQNCMSVYI